MLFRRARIGVAVNLGVASAVLVALWQAVPAAKLLLWYAAVLAVTAARGLLVYAFARSNADRLARWRERFVFLTALSGATWGSVVLLLGPTVGPLPQVVVILALAGLCTGAVAALAVVWRAYAWYLASIIPPVVLWLWLLGTVAHRALAGMVVIYAIALLMLARSHRRGLLGAWSLAARNVGLARRLRRANRDLSASNESLESRIDERREAEHDAQRSEARFRDMATIAADWFWECDTRLCFVGTWGRHEALLGLGREQIVGRRLADLLSGHGVDAARAEGCSAALSAGHSIDDLEVGWRRPDGAMRFLRLSAKAVLDDDDRVISYRGSARNATAEHRLAARLAYQARYDPLTGLISRREFERRVQRVLATPERGENALCYLDLDQFKVVNDTCGHVAGDELLRQLVGVLQQHVRGRDSLARLGGDEFALLMEHCPLVQASRVANELRESVAEFRFNWEGRIFSIGVSVGVVAMAGRGQTFVDLLRAADAACYAAKDEGRNRVHVYEPDDAELAQRFGEMQWVSRITEALEDGRFELLAQPIVPVARGARPDQHYELLLRMRGLDEKLIPPSAFLPAAERYSLATRLDRWVVETALQWLEAHPRHLNSLHLCAINLSGRSIGDQGFLARLIERLAASNVAAEKLCFEITETAVMANLANAVRFIRSLKGLGCSFALDDFGSGLSSFAYLKKLPVDYLKIDGTFVRDLATDRIDRAIVKSINDIGHVIGKRTIAEFVESETILDHLREIGVDYAQGFGIGRPMPLAELAVVAEDEIPRRARA